MPGRQFSHLSRIRKAAVILGSLLNRRWVRWALLLVVMATLIHRTDRNAWLATLSHFDLRHGVLMVAIYLLLILLFAWRWQLIASALGIRSDYIGFVRGLWFSQAAGEVGPPLLVGEMARFHALQGQGDNTRLLLSQLMDRCSG